MKKTTLDLDTLAVESFAAAPAALEPRGTVRGNEATGNDCSNIGGCGCTRAITGCGYPPVAAED